MDLPQTWAARCDNNNVITTTQQLLRSTWKCKAGGNTCRWLHKVGATLASYAFKNSVKLKALSHKHFHRNDFTNKLIPHFLNQMKYFRPTENLPCIQYDRDPKHWKIKGKKRPYIVNLIWTDQKNPSVSLVLQFVGACHEPFSLFSTHCDWIESIF